MTRLAHDYERCSFDGHLDALNYARRKAWERHVRYRVRVVGRRFWAEPRYWVSPERRPAVAARWDSPW